MCAWDQNEHAVAVTLAKEADTKRKRLRDDLEAMQEKLRLKHQRGGICDFVGQYQEQLGRSVAAELDKSQLLQQLQEHRCAVSAYI